MRILHADDDAVSREVIRMIIESENRHQLTTVTDGEEAWRQLSDPAQSFDLAIIDMMMPRLDGIGLVERIRATGTISSLPVIFCTALSDRATVGRAAQLAVGHYIVKPYRKAVVLEKLRSIESGWQRHASSEGPAEVCSRLGVPVEMLTRLVSNLSTEITAWAAATAATNDSAEFQRLAIAANGFKGACLNLGLSALGAELESMEAVILEEAGSRHRLISLVAPPEIAAGLRRVSSELERTGERFKPPV